MLVRLRNNGLATIVVVILLVSSMFLYLLISKSQEAGDRERGTSGSDFWSEDVPESIEYKVPVDASLVSPLSGRVADVRDITSEAGGLIERVGALEGMSSFEGLGFNFRDAVYLDGFEQQEIELSVSSEFKGALDGTIAQGGERIINGGRAIVLLPGAGLVVLDISNPPNVRPLGALQFFGEPLLLVPNGDWLYVLVSASHPSWYNSSETYWDPSWGAHPYRVGGRLVVVDISNVTRPHIERSLGLEGYPTAACRVRDRLLILGNNYGWTRWEAPDEDSVETEIVCLSLLDPGQPTLAGRIFLGGETGCAHVSDGCLFVTGIPPGSGRARSSPRNCTLTCIDYGDGGAGLLPRSSIEVDGRVNGASWLDHWNDRLYLFTVGGVHFEGNLLQVIEFPPEGQSFVLDGYSMTGVEVGDVVFRGNRILALCPNIYYSSVPESTVAVMVRGTNGAVGGPFQLIVRSTASSYVWINDELLISGDNSSSFRASFDLFHINIDPLGVPRIVETLSFMVEPPNTNRSIDVEVSANMISLDATRGVVVVPYSYEYKQMMDGWSMTTMHAKEVLIFYLDSQTCRFIQKGNLTVPDEMPQPIQLFFNGPWGMDVPNRRMYVRCISLEDNASPAFGPIVRLLPDVQEARCIDGFCVRVVRDYGTTYDINSAMELWIDRAADVPSTWTTLRVTVPGGYSGWFFNGALVHFYGLEVDTSGNTTAMMVVTTVNLTDPLHPVIGSMLRKQLGLKQDLGEESPYSIWWPRRYEAQNPLLIERKAFVFVCAGAVHLVDISNATEPRFIRSITYDYGFARDIRAFGRTLFITNQEHRLHRLVLDDPWHSRRMPVVWIPGIPLAFEEATGLVITQAEWRMAEVPEYTLNAVDIVEDRATIVWAIDVSHFRVVVDGGTAVLIDPNWNAYNNYVRNGYTYLMNTTYLFLGLDDNSGPRLASALEVTGAMNQLVIADDLLLVQERSITGVSGLFALDRSDPGNVILLGPYEVLLDWEPYYDAHMEGGVLVMSLSERGILFVDV